MTGEDIVGRSAIVSAQRKGGAGRRGQRVGKVGVPSVRDRLNGVEIPDPACQPAHGDGGRDRCEIENGNVRAVGNQVKI